MDLDELAFLRAVLICTSELVLCMFKVQLMGCFNLNIGISGNYDGFAPSCYC